MKPKQIASILLVLCLLMAAVPAYAAQFSYSELNEYRHIIQNEALDDFKGRVSFSVDVDAQAVRIYADEGDRDAITAALKRFGINMDMVIIEGQARETSTAVATANVNIRSGPGTSYKKLGTLKNGQSISVIKISNKWAQFIWNGSVAYVHADYIKYGNAVPVTPEGEPSVGGAGPGASIATATANVNIRSGPGTGYSKLGQLRKGQQVSVKSVTGRWAEVVLSGGSSAYVHTQYLRFSTGGGAPSLTKDDREFYELNIREAMEVAGLAGTYYLYLNADETGYIVVTQPALQQKTADVIRRYGVDMNRVIVQSQSPRTARTTGNVNVRSGPGTNYSKLGMLTRDTPISVLYISGKWAQIAWHNNRAAFVYTNYISVR